MSMNSRSRLLGERNPQAIKRETITEALGITHMEHDEQEYHLRTAPVLRLEFKQILQIENLGTLKSITRLFLDNNLIEKISGLDELRHLVWLDLSFNRIQVLEGLEVLRQLEVFAINNNQISCLKHMEHMKKLKVLRLGDNRLSRKEEIIYLRKLKSLRTLSIRGNPLCGEIDDFEGYLIAMLPDLVYLECHNISQQEKEAATNAHQGDIFRVQQQEERANTERESREQELATERLNKAAFVATLKGERLLAALLAADSVTETELRSRLNPFKGNAMLQRQFEEDIIALGNQLHQLGLEQHEVRLEEVRLFEECVQVVRKQNQEKGIKKVEAFLGEKERLLDAFYDMAGQIEEKDGEELDDLRRGEVCRIKEELSNKTKDTWLNILSQEVELVNSTEKILGMFENTLTDMLMAFLESAKVLFSKARIADTRYFRCLSELAESLEETPYTLHRAQETATDHQPESAKEPISALMTRCHDIHQDLLLSEEANLEEAVNSWKEDYLSRFRRKERRRNRDRVLELNHFLDTVKREIEEEMEILQDKVEDDDEPEEILVPPEVPPNI